MIIGGREERLSDPEQILLRLERQRDTRPDPGMDEKPMPVLVRQRKLPNPCQVFGRKIAGVIDTVALKGLFAAIPPPIQEIAIRATPAGSPDQHLLMIAAQAGTATFLIRLLSDEKIHHPTTVRPSVDIITDEDEPGILSMTRKIAHGEQREQFVEAPVNVANCERQ